MIDEQIAAVEAELERARAQSREAEVTAYIVVRELLVLARDSLLPLAAQIRDNTGA